MSRQDDGGVNDRGYTRDQQVMLDDAKRTHAATTATAQRALQTANQTRQLAADTLEELHTQGEKLEKVDRDLDDIDHDVKEAKSLLAYMRRCCCCFVFSCCCDCDADVERDRQRRQRVKARAEARRGDTELSQMEKDRRTHQSNAHNNDAQRSELIGNGKARGRPGDRMDQGIGQGLHEADQAEIRRHTDTQNAALDGISSALDDLTHIADAMGSELDQQNRRIDATGAHAENAHDDLRNVQRGARQDFKLRVR